MYCTYTVWQCMCLFRYLFVLMQGTIIFSWYYSVQYRYPIIWSYNWLSQDYEFVHSNIQDMMYKYMYIFWWRQFLQILYVICKCNTCFCHMANTGMEYTCLCTVNVWGDYSQFFKPFVDFSSWIKRWFSAV